MHQQPEECPREPKSVRERSWYRGLNRRFSLLQILLDDPQYIDAGTMIWKAHYTRSEKVYFSGVIRLWPKDADSRVFASDVAHSGAGS